MDTKSKAEFLELYKDAHESLSRFCAAKCYGVMDPADLVSETVLAALEGFEKLRNKKAFLAFLFTIANNKLNGHLRRKKFKGAYHEEQAEARIDNGQSADSKFDISILYRALNQLPEKEKEALILFEISGFAIKEIMEIQDSGESAVKQRLRRGRAKLAQLFKDDRRKVLAAVALVIMSQNANSTPTPDAFFEIARNMEIPVSHEQVVEIINSYQGMTTAASGASKFGAVSGGAQKLLLLSGVPVLTVVTVLTFIEEQPAVNAPTTAFTQGLQVEQPGPSPTILAPQSNISNAAIYTDFIPTTAKVATPDYHVDKVTTFELPLIQVAPASVPLVGTEKTIQSIADFAEPTPDTTYTTTSQTASIQKGGTLHLDLDECDVVVKTWDKDYMEITASISFDAKDDASAEVANKHFLPELTARAEDVYISASGYNMICNNFHMKYGKYTFKNGDKAFIRKLDIHYTLNVPEGVHLNLKAAYSKVIVPNLNANLSVDLDEGKLFAGNVDGDVDLDLSYAEAFLGSFKEGKIVVNESDLEFETAGNLNLDARYSNVTFKSAGDVRLDASEGKLNFEKANELNGDISYLSVDLGEISTIDVTVSESKIEVDKVESMQLSSSYSNYTIGAIEQIHLKNSTDDDFDIRQLGVIEGESRYSNFEISNLTVSANMENYECNVDIDKISQSFKGVDFDGKYSNYQLDFASKISYDLEVKGEYIGLSYPKESSEITKWVHEDDQLELLCSVNKGSGDAVLVRFKCYEGKIDLSD